MATSRPMEGGQRLQDHRRESGGRGIVTLPGRGGGGACRTLGAAVWARQSHSTPRSSSMIDVRPRDGATGVASHRRRLSLTPMAVAGHIAAYPTDRYGVRLAGAAARSTARSHHAGRGTRVQWHWEAGVVRLLDRHRPCQSSAIPPTTNPLHRPTLPLHPPPCQTHSRL